MDAELLTNRPTEFMVFSFLKTCQQVFRSWIWTLKSGGLCCQLFLDQQYKVKWVKIVLLLGLLS